MWVYNMTVESGHFDVLRRSFGAISDDQRVQAIIVAFCFGALMEALAGFGTPVAIGSVMLIGHNPGLHNLALVLASRGADLPQLEEKFPTGGLATLIVHSKSWAALSPGDAELIDYAVPRYLD